MHDNTTTQTYGAARSPCITVSTRSLLEGVHVAVCSSSWPPTGDALPCFEAPEPRRGVPPTQVHPPRTRIRLRAPPDHADLRVIDRREWHCVRRSTQRSRRPRSPSCRDVSRTLAESRATATIVRRLPRSSARRRQTRCSRCWACQLIAMIWAGCPSWRRWRGAEGVGARCAGPLGRVATCSYATSSNPLTSCLCPRGPVCAPLIARQLGPVLCTNNLP